jgi:hypothetical protein
MRTENTKTALRTAALAAAVLMAFAAIFSIQIVTHSGPAGALTQAALGSPEWAAAASRWNRLQSYVVWPLLVIVGAALQRLWCPRAAFWTATFVAVPAAVAQFSTQRIDILHSLGYLALAALVGLTVSLARKRPSAPQSPSTR